MERVDDVTYFDPEAQIFHPVVTWCGRIWNTVPIAIEVLGTIVSLVGSGVGFFDEDNFQASLFLICAGGFAALGLNQCLSTGFREWEINRAKNRYIKKVELQTIENEKLKELSRGVSSHIESLKMHTEDLEEFQSEMQAELEEKKKLLKELRGVRVRLKEVTKIMESYKVLYQELKKALTTTSENIRNFVDHNTSLEETVENAKGTLERLKANQDTIRKRLNELGVENKKFDKKRVKVEGLLGDLFEEILRFEKNFTQNEKERLEIQTELEEMKKTQQFYKEQVDLLEDKVVELKNQKKELNKMLKEFQKMLKESGLSEIAKALNLGPKKEKG